MQNTDKRINTFLVPGSEFDKLGVAVFDDTEKMIYEDGGKKLAIKNIQDVDTIYIGNSKFLVLNDIFIETQ